MFWRHRASLFFFCDIAELKKKRFGQHAILGESMLSYFKSVVTADVILTEGEQVHSQIRCTVVVPTGNLDLYRYVYT